jgi:hypothetical protein|eukprot:SAG25_NODE_2469_length_1586_cov_3.734718_2_plen_90_part_00
MRLCWWWPLQGDYFVGPVCESPAHVVRLGLYQGADRFSSCPYHATDARKGCPLPAVATRAGHGRRSPRLDSCFSREASSELTVRRCLHA